jgi:hypothetical protein
MLSAARVADVIRAWFDRKQNRFQSILRLPTLGLRHLRLVNSSYRPERNSIISDSRSHSAFVMSESYISDEFTG